MLPLGIMKLGERLSINQALNVACTSPNTTRHIFHCSEFFLAGDRRYRARGNAAWFCGAAPQTQLAQRPAARSGPPAGGAALPNPFVKPRPVRLGPGIRTGLLVQDSSVLAPSPRREIGTYLSFCFY